MEQVDFETKSRDSFAYSWGITFKLNCSQLSLFDNQCNLKKRAYYLHSDVIFFNRK